jgi:hypothetical protein
VRVDGGEIGHRTTIRMHLHALRGVHGNEQAIPRTARLTIELATVDREHGGAPVATATTRRPFLPHRGGRV